jgi:hypothetical protein
MYALNSGLAEGSHQASSILGLGSPRIPERSSIHVEGRFAAIEDSKSAFARRFRGSAKKNSEAGWNFARRVAGDALSANQLRSLNSFQPRQRLAAFELEFDPTL